MSNNFEQLYIKNINYFNNLSQKLHLNIVKSDVSFLEILPTSNGVNIAINNHLLYPPNINESITLQVNTFLNNKTAFFQKPTSNNGAKTDPLHINLLQSIENTSSYLKEGVWSGYGENHFDSIPVLLCFGIGNGLYIEQLIKQIDIKHLIIIDKDFSFLKLSSHLVDWQKINEKFSRSGYQLQFIIKDDPSTITRILLNDIYNFKPYINSFIPYFSHYNSSFFQEIQKNIQKNIHLTYNGLGFIDDELLSLKRTLKNLEHNIPVYMGTNKKLPSNATLFIVASGPSIDKDIQYIKKNQNNAVIFSCGTALRVLEKNDIVPDFHFEIERGDGTHEILQQYTSQEFRDKVALIGLNVLNNKIFTEDFKEKYLYFRASDAGSSIVPDNIPKLFYTNPTVTNAAITFASEFVWDKVYLFGADMGFKDTQNHHSKDTFHYTQGEKKYNWDDHGAANITNEFPSNFGNDTVFSTRVFSWAKQTIENTINLHNLQLHNCSDGAKIEHSSPFYSKDISIVSHNKQEVISTIKSNFKDLHTHEPQFKKNYKTQTKLYNTVIDSLTDICNNTISSYNEMLDILNQLYITLYNFTDKKNLQNPPLGVLLLKGTITMTLSIIYSHTMATKNYTDAIKYANDTLKTLSIKLMDFKNVL